MEKKEIDARVMDALWNNIEEIKVTIRQEVNKASLILGYLGTFFFVMSSKLSLLDSFTVRLLIVGTFLLSLLLSFYVIFTGKVRQLQVLDFVEKDWDRHVILERCKELYTQEMGILRTKTIVNNLNILFVALVTLGFLLLIV